MLSKPPSSLTQIAYFSLFLSALPVSAASTPTSGTCDPNNHWISPAPPASSPTSLPYAAVPQWTPGETMSLTWVADWPAFTLGIWFQSAPQQAINFGDVLLNTTNATPQTYTYNWVVSSVTQTYTTSYNRQYYFEFGDGGIGGKLKCGAPYFRVVANTGAAVDSFPTASSATSRRRLGGVSSTTTMTATATATGSVVTATVTRTGSSTVGQPSVTDTASNNSQGGGSAYWDSSSGLSTGSKVAIGVGVGLGVPLIAVAGFLLGRYHRARRADASAEGNEQQGYVPSQAGMQEGASVLGGGKPQGAGSNVTYRYS